MSSRIDRELAMNALLMAVWRRHPNNTVMVRSDQGSQFSSYDWRDYLDEHNLQQSMSRRGNCHDNAVAESFFQLLKRERIRRKTYGTRDQARQDVLTCSTIRSGGTASATTCRRLSTMNSIFSACRVPGKLVAIHIAPT
jgi:hypothetical protein